MLTAEHVIVSASALGTQRLLHRMKAEGHLPRLSDRLGYLARTNSESILGAIAPRHLDRLQHGRGDHLVVPPRRAHPHRAGALRQGQQRDEPRCRPCSPTATAPAPRWRTWLKEMWRQKRNLTELLRPQALVRARRHRPGHAEPSTTRSRPTSRSPRSPAGCVLTSKQGHGEPNPTWIPQANEAVRRMAEIMGGIPGGSIGEPFNMPLTAHFIGGCTIGATEEQRGHRRLPAGLQLPRSARRRRLGDLAPTSASTRR